MKNDISKKQVKLDEMEKENNSRLEKKQEELK